MPTPTFDGPSLTITLPSLGSYDAKIDLYSDWKEWVKDVDNSKYPPAFDVVGGDEISATQNVGSYFFLRNDLGWRIKAPEADGEVVIEGDLLGRSSTTPVFIPSTGDFTVVIRLVVSARTIVVATGGSGGGLTVAQDARLTLIEKLLRNKLTTDPVTGILTLYDDNGTTLMTAQLYEDVAGSQTYRGQGSERRERLT